jgi:hypothetical protein
MEKMYVVIDEYEVDSNLKRALDKAHYKFGGACEVLSFGTDKIFIRIGNKILDIFPSKVTLVSKERAYKINEQLFGYSNVDNESTETKDKVDA